MYGPAPDRLRKAGIARSGEGCQPCRKRRRRCDQKKPCCKRCEQAGENCAYASLAVQFKDFSQERGQPLATVHVTAEDVLHRAVGELPVFVFDHWVYPLGRDAAAETHSAPSRGAVDDVPNLVKRGSAHACLWGVKSQGTCGGGQTSIPRYLPHWSTLTPQDRFYLHHFTSCVMDCVSPYFAFPETVASGDEGVLLAAMALGAADLATRYGKFVMHPGRQNYNAWEPDQKHKLAGLQYTGDALSRAINRTTHAAAAVVTMHLLLATTEVALGTCAGLHRWMKSIEKLMAESRDQISSCKECQKLRRGVASMRVVMDFLAGPCNSSAGDLDVNQAADGLDDDWLEERPDWLPLQDIGMQSLTATRNIALLSALRDNVVRPDPLLETLIERLCPLLGPSGLYKGSKVPSLSELDESIEDAMGKIKELERIMDAFPPPKALASAGLVLDDSHRLVEWELPDLRFDYSNRCVEITPISLETHEETMDVAHYAFCRIVCNVEVLQNFIAHKPAADPAKTDDMNPWLKVLLGVARGLSLKPRTPSDLYRRGISSLVFQAAGRCGSFPAYVYLLQHIERLRSAGVGWDDMTFPVQLSRYVIDFISREAQLGRKVLIMDEVNGALSDTEPILKGLVDGAVIAYGVGADGEPYTIKTVISKDYFDSILWP